MNVALAGVQELKARILGSQRTVSVLTPLLTSYVVFKKYFVTSERLKGIGRDLLRWNQEGALKHNFVSCMKNSPQPLPVHRSQSITKQRHGKYGRCFTVAS